MKTPAVIARWIADEGETEESMKAYVLASLEAFKQISEKSTTEEGWIAFKLGCKLPAARAAIAWARIVH
jgi:hypothetical protein